MPTIHLMHGYMGFGKTTLAKQLEKTLPAIRFTHDELMVQRYGRTPNDFETKFKKVDTYIRAQTAKEIHRGNNVILDYGFWDKQSRKEYYTWAKTLTDNVVFHAFECDMTTAKNRVLNRTATDTNELNVDENIFNQFLYRYTPLTAEEGYPVIFHQPNFPIKTPKMR